MAVICHGKSFQIDTETKTDEAFRWEKYVSRHNKPKVRGIWRRNADLKIGNVIRSVIIGYPWRKHRSIFRIRSWEYTNRRSLEFVGKISTERFVMPREGVPCVSKYIRIFILRTSKFGYFYVLRGDLSWPCLFRIRETRRRSKSNSLASIETTNERVNYRRVDGRKRVEGNSRRILVGLPYPYSRPIVRVINAARSGGRLIDGSQKPVAAWSCRAVEGERDEYGVAENTREEDRKRMR